MVTPSTKQNSISVDPLSKDVDKDVDDMGDAHDLDGEENVYDEGNEKQWWMRLRI